MSETPVTPLLSGSSTATSRPIATRAQSTWLTRSVRKLTTKLPAVSSVSFGDIWHASVEFMKDPINIALVVWMVLSVPACVAIVMVKLGLLDDTIPDHEERERLDETATQFVNALFVLTCLIVFPLLCRHTFLLMRWQPKDKLELREAYCKNGKRKPHDWTHMAIVVFWGQVTCWATVAFAAVYWLWPYGTQRPALFLQVSFILSMVAPVFSLLHLLLSPLSQDYDIVRDTDEAVFRMFRRTTTFFQSHRQVDEAQWNGSVVPDCCTDKQVACLVCLFPCCMFGYNMERLGFGHRVVHTLVFIIVLFAPVTVFFICASSLKHMGLTGHLAYKCGIILTVLGVAYGGAWRIRIRETYHLPGYPCLGSRRLTDVCTWVWCSYCALCQEIRTADQYKVEKMSFYSTSRGEDARVPVEEGDEEDIESGEEGEGSEDAESGGLSDAPKPQVGFQR